MTREGTVMITGTILSNIGLAISSLAAEKKFVYLASEPLADSIVWEKGNDYTFRLRASTYMQASMLAEAASKTDAKTFATIAPNYAYGKDAVAAFKKTLTALRPDVEFVTEQWPALFKIDAGAEVQAIERAKPDAIYNVTFGGDLAKFVREGTTRGLFDGRNVYGLLTGEPEYLDPLKDEAPEGWTVTGYPWYDFGEGANKTFVDAYQARFEERPGIGSLVGYMTVQSIAAGITKAGATDTDSLIAGFEGLDLDTPVGPIHFREIDHQATMGAFVGTTALKDGAGILVDWEYKKGEDYLQCTTRLTLELHCGINHRPDFNRVSQCGSTIPCRLWPVTDIRCHTNRQLCTRFVLYARCIHRLFADAGTTRRNRILVISITGRYCRRIDRCNRRDPCLTTRI